MLTVETRFDPEQELYFFKTGVTKPKVVGPVKVKDLAITVVLEPDESASYHEEYHTYCGKILVWHSNMENDIEIFAKKETAETAAVEAQAKAQLEA